MVVKIQKIKNRTLYKKANLFEIFYFRLKKQFAKITEKSCFSVFYLCIVIFSAIFINIQIFRGL
jgi:hypothetical protein